MNVVVQNLWTPLETTPLLWLAVTLAAYSPGRLVQQACKGSAFASPVLIAMILVAAVVLATRTSYQAYFAGAQFINFLLGPATIALAVPLAKNYDLIRKNLHNIGLALLTGSITSVVSGVAIVWLLGGSKIVALSMAPKAVTTPIAMAVSQEIGGVPALTAEFWAASSLRSPASRCFIACRSRTGARTASRPAWRAAASRPRKSLPAMSSAPPLPLSALA
jgi:putative effector of murein hydrolase